jgi:hypothetical protein
MKETKNRLRINIIKSLLFGLTVLLIASGPNQSYAQTWQSSRVYYGSNNKLVYVPDTEMNIIPDFSYAGYKNGESEIPFITVIKTISPITGDNTSYIQSVLDSLGNAGAKGALLLSPGNYEIWGTLKLKYSGLVLRGSGDGNDSLTNTILKGKGDTPTQRTILIAGGGSSSLWKDQVAGTKTNITSDTVLIGSREFYVENVAPFSVGDNIIIYHPCSAGWLEAVDYGGTHSIAPDQDTAWAVNSNPIVYNRYIKAISGNKITIDAPVFNHLIKSLSQSYIYKYSRSGMKTDIGIENLRIDIETLGGEDESHPWEAVDLYQLEDSWVKNCTFLHFGHSGIRINTGTRITVENCKALDPVSIITGERRYNFNVYTGSQQILFKNCYATNGRHHYVSNGYSWTSGVVFLNCTSSGAYTSSEGHRQWSQGILYDNHRELDGPRTGLVPRLLGLYNRGNYGTAHGWAIAHSVAWNCDVAAGDLIVQKPPTAQNYAIGCKGLHITGIKPPAPFNEPGGYIEGTNTLGLYPQSLYMAQLQDRLGVVTGPQTYTSTSNGNWSTMNWNPPGTPGALDNVIIPNGDTVTIDQNVTINNLTVGGGTSGALQFSKLTLTSVVINGNLLIQAGGVLKVQPNGNPSPIGNLIHTIDLKGNLTHHGNILDFRSGSAGTTLGVCNLILSGNNNSILNVSTSYSSTNGDFNAVTINKTGGAKVILGSNIIMNGGSGTGPAAANSVLTFISGVVETGDFIWICQTTTEANVTGYSSTSYINGAMGRGISNAGGASKNFPVGDANGFELFNLHSTTAGTSTGHYAIVRCIPGNANTGSSVFNNGIDKVSRIRYYQIGYNNILGGAPSMGFNRFSPSYGTDDGVAVGNTNLRVAYSVDNRAIWQGMNQTILHTTNLTSPPTTIIPDSLTLGNYLTLNSGTGFIYVAIARVIGTTENSLESSLVLNLSALIEAMYVSGGTEMTMSPSVTVELHDASTYALVESKTGTLSKAGVGRFAFTTAANATPYYVVVKSVNTIETWGATVQRFTSGALSYNFSTAQTQAFGGNMIQKGSKWCIYSGDVSKDATNIVDGSDVIAVDNDNTYTSSNLVTDITGDGIVDGSDVINVDNNNTYSISRQAPGGAPVAKRVIRNHIQQKSSVK